mmetsp:Transcript_5457/g.15165  ORF Transcript_5457/g.15165 Transcript_5457/m.15165 type:complete len:227 (+) Transcript_5457:322-1002(+)
MAASDQRGPVHIRLRGREPQLQDPGDDGLLRPIEAGARLRVRSDPALPRGEVRQGRRLLPQGVPLARGVPVLAHVADGERAVRWWRLRALLQLRPYQDRVCHRPVHHGDEAAARRAGQAPRSWGPVRLRGAVHHRRHGDLAVDGQPRAGAALQRRRVPAGGGLHARARLGEADRRAPRRQARPDGEPPVRREVGAAARAARSRRLRDQDARQGRGCSIGAGRAALR